MKILIAEDDAISRRLLEANLEHAGYKPVATGDGEAAWNVLNQPEGPRLAILDWMMPSLDGLEVCRRVRSSLRSGYIYLILLTARGQREDMVAGFEAGADDFLTKPFDPHELRARVAVGRRLLKLQGELEDKVDELEQAMSHVKQLQGLLPICMHCRKVRDDADTWHRLETYIEQNSHANFTHSLCAECLTTHYPGYGDADPKIGDPA